MNIIVINFSSEDNVDTFGTAALQHVHVKSNDFNPGYVA